MPDTEMTIHIKDLDLPESVIKAISAKIHSATLHELSKLDLVTTDELKIKLKNNGMPGMIIQGPDRL